MNDSIEHLYRIYGEYVAVLLIDGSERLRYEQLQKLKWLCAKINDFSEYPKELLSLIEVDYLITKIDGDCTIDLFQLDLYLERLYPEYDRHECTYQGKENISICEMIKIIYGRRGVELIESLI